MSWKSVFLVLGILGVGISTNLYAACHVAYDCGQDPCQKVNLCDTTTEDGKDAAMPTLPANTAPTANLAEPIGAYSNGGVICRNQRFCDAYGYCRWRRVCRASLVGGSTGLQAQ